MECQSRVQRCHCSFDGIPHRLGSGEFKFFPVTCDRRDRWRFTVGSGPKGGKIIFWLVATQTYVIFIPDPWGNDPIWRAYFSNGLVQPPTSFTGWLLVAGGSISNYNIVKGVASILKKTEKITIRLRKKKLAASHTWHWHRQTKLNGKPGNWWHPVLTWMYLGPSRGCQQFLQVLLALKRRPKTRNIDLWGI